MGRRLDGFDIELTFDEDGRVATTAYCDGEGCGISRPFDQSTPLGELVEYHLKHYKVSHRMTPQRMCNFVLPHPTRPETEYHCSREPHSGDDHELVSRTRK